MMIQCRYWYEKEKEEMREGRRSNYFYIKKKTNEKKGKEEKEERV